MRLLLPLLILFACAEPRGLRVFAAASLTDVLTEAAAVYTQKTGEELSFNFAASSTLARQIDAGAPADVFLSADEARMDWLAERGRIDAATRVSLFSNALVIVVPSDSPARIASERDLQQFDRIALAEPATVPAGVYARTHLERLGLWERIAPKVIPAENVRAAMYAVESGNAGAAIVYATDAKVSRRVRVAHEIANSTAISYPAAVVSGSVNAERARRFLEWLASNDARGIFEKHGFIIQNPKPKI
jgi:molybdate transport system substrate-binding protein